MPKPSREQLATFLIDSDVFKGIDIEAALNEFYDKIYPEAQDSTLFIVLGGTNELPQVVTATYDESFIAKINKTLGNIKYFCVQIDQYKNEVESGMDLFRLQVKNNGNVDYVEQTTAYTVPSLEFGPGWAYITGTFWGFDSKMAVDTAYQVLLDCLDGDLKG